MNYSDEILQNKPLEILKQILYFTSLGLSIVLMAVLVAVYGFKVKLYEVMTGSEEPYLPQHCLAVVVPKDKYKVGDILTFTQGGSTVTHRIIGLYKEGNNTIYLCHGDNVQAADPNCTTHLNKWEKDAKYVGDMLKQYGTLENIPSADKPKNVQKVYTSQTLGKVVGRVQELGSVITNLKQNIFLFIALVVGVWCICTVI